MRLATILHKGQRTAALEIATGYLPLPALDLNELLLQAGWKSTAETILSTHRAHDVIVSAEATLLTPLPNPHKVICCGLNYSDHILEMGRELPEYPTLFAKFADTLTGPHAKIVSEHSENVDWEAELAVIVGGELRNASEAEAANAIAGYTIANDVSMRDWQRRTLQWFQGKAFDGTTPLGPVLVTADSLDPEAGLDVICTLNGEEVQHGNTKTLVFSSARLLSYISTFTVLRPGDIVLTGTPGGVGMGMVPPRFLHDGDTLETTITGIGTLSNTFSIKIPANASPTNT
ncbi:2-hydroxyhepta-2,4-diene-1,7-dioate isomerase [Arthrobacter sp. MYb227]|uniref:fumarylacetoacetate hydrolase family protein n=1 Tax=Arthrobacter sp. MYb227 TaxID=1848601 RepID=UPI000CFCCFBD|nr:fumarylacetoacetate hydrolase family protein [Arthrobacter sp. MYb227]PQZ87701.1 2-hydroxyhepta-2,4-diene-1,7-dioate isomerase [Arthrobacter sp. MYb227]